VSAAVAAAAEAQVADAVAHGADAALQAAGRAVAAGSVRVWRRHCTPAAAVVVEFVATGEVHLKKKKKFWKGVREGKTKEGNERAGKRKRMNVSMKERANSNEHESIIRCMMLKIKPHSVRTRIHRI